MSEIEDSVDRMLSEMRQLRDKKGPYYEKWLKNYRRSVTTHCRKIAKHYKQSRWLQGMEGFLTREEMNRGEGNILYLPHTTIREETKDEVSSVRK
ncbi:unnamed protein product [marine sediment metagenome]|uniref:Uncharacterized protein n=1 Tax=marine sediment metagenome TaxID=412755 RepID=X1P6I1_9ZZZZ